MTAVEAYLNFVSTLMLNDVLFFIMQLLLIWCAFYSLYERHARARVRLGTARLTKRSVATLQKGVLQLRKINTKLLNRRKGSKGSVQLIVVDSIHSLSMSGNAMISVYRGEGSWEYFALAWTVLSVFVIEANGLYESTAVTGISIGVVVLDLLIITYLCFVSSWFRNKIIALVNLRNSKPD